MKYVISFMFHPKCYNIESGKEGVLCSHLGRRSISIRRIMEGGNDICQPKRILETEFVI